MPSISIDIVTQGRLDIQWLDERGELDGVQGLIVKAAEHGCLHIVRWLIDRDAARSGIFTHLTDIGGEASLAINAAAVNGHLEVAQYLYVRTKAPENDLQHRLQILEQRKQRRTLWTHLGPNSTAGRVSGRIMVKATENGFLDVVQWLNAISDVAVISNIFGYWYADTTELFVLMQWMGPHLAGIWM